MARINQQAEALVKIVGDDQFSSLLSKIQKDIVKTVANQKAQVAATKKQVRATERLRHTVDGVRESWAMVAVGVQAVIGIAHSVANAVRGIHDQMKMAAQEHGVEVRFRSMTAAIGGAGLVMDRLRAASQDAIDDTTLQRLFATAKSGGIELGQTLKLIEMGAKAANAGYGGTAEMAEKFIATITKGEDEVLRTLGWNIKLESTVGRLAAEMVVGERAVDEALKKQVRYNEVIRVAGEELKNFKSDGYVTQVDKATAAWENLAAEMRRAAMLKTIADPRWAELEATIAALNKTEAEARKEIELRSSAYFQRSEIQRRQIGYQKQLNAILVQTPGFLELVTEKIQKQAAAQVRSLGFVKEGEARNTALKRATEDLARVYGVYDLVIKKANKNQENLNKAIAGGKSEIDIQKAAVAARAKAATQAQEVIERMIAGNKLRRNTAMLEARAAVTMKESSIAVKKYGDVIKILGEKTTLTREEQNLLAEAEDYVARKSQTASQKARDMIAAQDAASKSAVDLNVELWRQYTAMGRGNSAAIAFNKAMAAVDAGAQHTAGSIDMIAIAANNAAAALKSSLLKEARAMEIKGTMMIADASADIRGLGQSMVAAAMHARDQAKAINVGTKRLKVKRRGRGGGGGKSEAARARKELKLFNKLKGRAAEILAELRAEARSTEEQFAGLGRAPNMFIKTMEESKWFTGALLMPKVFDVDAHKKTMERFQMITEMNVTKYNEAVVAIQDKYNKLFEDKELKKSKRIQEMLKEGMSTELEEMRLKFEAEQRMRDAALEKEQTYTNARIEQAQFASGIAKGMRSELSQYEMDWVEDQYALGAALANSLDQMEAQMNNFKKIQVELKKSGRDAGQAWKEAGPGMLAGAGQVAAGFIDNEVAKASVLGIMETAASAASFATGDVVGGSMHAAAAATYFTVAGLTSAGVMRRGGADSTKKDAKTTADKAIATPDTITEEKAAPTVINVHFTGSTIVGSDEARLQRDFSRIMRDANQHGGRDNVEAVGD